MSRIIINFTMHPATEDQKAAGVMDLSGQDLVNLKNLLNFEDIPSVNDIECRVDDLMNLLYDLLERNDGDLQSDSVELCSAEQGSFAPSDSVMIGGAGFLLPVLQERLIENSFYVLHAFSKRVSEEVMQADGSVKKANVFKHIGFVEF